VTATLQQPTDISSIGDQFLTLLPRVKACARFAARRVRHTHDRADLEAEVIALAWKWFVLLARRGKDPRAFVATLALRCGQAARAGRRLAGCEGATDVLSRVAKVRHGVRVGGLAEAENDAGQLSEALAENTRTRVPDQVAFRQDFPRWRAGLSDRDRAVMDALMAGDRTGAVASRFGISPARVSQLRTEFRRSWLEFISN
jgi:hypothetical protein